MSRLITASDMEVVEPGGYNGTLTSIIEGNGKFGDFYDWNFKVDGPDGPVEVSRRTSAKFGPSTLSRKFVNALLGRTVEKGEQVDLDSLIGRKARLKIDTNENGYSTIDDIAPLPGAQAVTPDEARVLAAAGPGSELKSDVPF